MLTFNVVLLGPSGASKSTFLSALNETISKQHFSGNFFVRPDSVTHDRLTGMYRKTSDTGQGWPAGNHYDDLVELSFTGCLGGASESFALYEIRYLDHDGRCLVDEHIDPRIRRRLTEKIKEADALLCVLDGEYIVALLKNTGRPPLLRI
ncbi:MAG: hypothetical protein M3308_11140 [Actinomycetota bacterium]|nr:hypothetical protein [Actinomycetota bacterium]